MPFRWEMLELPRLHSIYSSTVNKTKLIHYWQ